MSLRILTLGNLELSRPNGERVDLPRQRIGLLLFIAISRIVSRDQVLATFWPETETDRARHALNQSLYAIRRAIGDDVITTHADQLSIAPWVSIDTVEFEAAVSRGDYKLALQLYKGGLLHGLNIASEKAFEAWIDQQRTHYERMHRKACRAEIDALVARNEIAAAVQVARAWCAVSPDDDEAHHRLIELLAAAGDRSEALRHYDVYEKAVVANDLTPLDETRALVTQIRSGSMPFPKLPVPERDRAAPSVIATTSYWRELVRRRILKTAGWYSVAAYGCVQVASTLQPIMRLPDWTPAFVLALLLIGFPIVLFLAWHFDFTSEGLVRARPSTTPSSPRSRFYSYATAAVAAAIPVVVWDGYTNGPVTSGVFSLFGRADAADHGNGPAGNTVAVLSFDNLSSDTANMYFAEGLAEELRNALATVPDLKVKGRTSSEVFREKRLPLPEVAAQLGAEILIEGSVRKVGQELRINVQAIDGKTGDQIWSQVYRRSSDNSLGVEAEISREIVAELWPGAIPQSVALTAGGTQNPQAYDLYIRARHHWNTMTPPKLHEALRLLDQAVKIDPKFAKAYVVMAETHLILDQIERRPTPKGLRESEKAIHKALTIAPDLPEALVVSAYLANNRFGADPVEIERRYRRGIELRPTANAYMWYAQFLNVRGRHELSLEMMKRAVELDPMSPMIQANLGARYMILGMFRDALNATDAASRLDSTFWVAQWVRGIVLMRMDNHTAAIALLEKAHNTSQSLEPLPMLVRAYERAGQRDKAVQVIDRLRTEARTSYVSPTYFASIHATLGNEAQAISECERAYSTHDMGYAWICRDVVAEFQSHPRARSLAQKSGWHDLLK